MCACEGFLLLVSQFCSPAPSRRSAVPTAASGAGALQAQAVATELLGVRGCAAMEGDGGTSDEEKTCQSRGF